MEAWQQKCINQNLPELIQNTECNSLLMATLIKREVISLTDMASIVCSKNPIDQANSLYTILKTRKNAYSVLKDTLLETTQTGAFHILVSSENEREEFGKYEKLQLNEEQKLQYSPVNDVVLYKGNFGSRNAIIKVYRNVTSNDLKEAKREIEILEKWDWHDNINRYFIAKYITDELYPSFAIAIEDHGMTLNEFKKDRDENGENIGSHSKTLLSQIWNGVTFLHQKRIVHLNLKPINILVRYSGISDHRKEDDTLKIQVKIAEFGLAKSVGEDDKVMVLVATLERAACFETPEVLDRELFLEMEEELGEQCECELDVKADVFCLASLLYYVISGGENLFGQPLSRRKENIRENRPLLQENYMKMIHRSNKPQFMEMLLSLPSQRPALLNLKTLFTFTENRSF